MSEINIHIAKNILSEAANKHLQGFNRESFLDLLQILIYNLPQSPESWQHWVDRYFEFRKQVGSPATRMDGRSGASLKKIQQHLEGIAPGKGYQAWDFILSNWTQLTPFLQSQITLSRMHSYLEEIIMKLNPHGAGKTKKESAISTTEAYKRDLKKRLSDSTHQASPPDPPG